MADIFKICVLKNFAILTRKHTCWSLFFNKVAELKTWNFIKKRLQHMRFPGNNDKFFQNNFFHRTPLVAASDESFNDGSGLLTRTFFRITHHGKQLTK